MRIKEFSINNFRSIINSGPVTLNPDITILLGKNEAGKTSILKALEKFDIKKEFKFEDLSLNSGIREKREDGHLNDEDIPIVTVTFEVEEEDKKKLKEIHSSLKETSIIKCTKFFDDSYDVKIHNVDLNNPNEEFNIKKSKELIDKIHESAKSFKGNLDSILQNTPFKQLQGNLESILDEIMSFNDLNDIDNINNHELERIVAHPTILVHINSFNNEIDSYKSEIKDILSNKEENLIVDQVLEILPNFIYFSTVEKLEDHAPISDLIQNKEDHKTLNNLLKLANIDLEKLEELGDRELFSKLRNESINISGEVNKSWKQKKVNIDINTRNDQVIVSIHDNKLKQFHSPNIRSEGFKWFLSFYINFTAGSKGEFKNTILLLDDPGVYLHASGQKDLLKTLERISKSNQIVLSTHSPFLVDRDKTNRIRIVSNEARGTKITEKFYKSKFDAFAPIRASIGMDIKDSLFIGNKTLLVEGYSDSLILNAMSNLLFKLGDNHIDSSQISILPVNSADKMPYFSAIFLNGKIEFVVLLDYDDKGKKVAKKLREEFDDDINIISFNELKGIKQGDLDIEDLIDFGFYLKALNSSYESIFQDKVHKKSISKKDLKSESFRGIKKYFKDNKAKIGDLDKIMVANEISEMIIKDQVPNEDTIKNFSNLFEMINNKFDI